MSLLEGEGESCGAWGALVSLIGDGKGALTVEILGSLGEGRADMLISLTGDGGGEVWDEAFGTGAVWDSTDVAASDCLKSFCETIFNELEALSSFAAFDLFFLDWQESDAEWQSLTIFLPQGPSSSFLDDPLGPSRQGFLPIGNAIIRGMENREVDTGGSPSSFGCLIALEAGFWLFGFDGLTTPCLIDFFFRGSAFGAALSGDLGEPLGTVAAFLLTDAFGQDSFFFSCLHSLFAATFGFLAFCCGLESVAAPLDTFFSFLPSTQGFLPNGKAEFDGILKPTFGFSGDLSVWALFGGGLAIFGFAEAFSFSVLGWSFDLDFEGDFFLTWGLFSSFDEGQDLGLGGGHLDFLAFLPSKQGFLPIGKADFCGMENLSLRELELGESAGFLGATDGRDWPTDGLDADVEGFFKTLANSVLLFSNSSDVAFPITDSADWLWPSPMQFLQLAIVISGLFSKQFLQLNISRVFKLTKSGSNWLFDGSFGLSPFIWSGFVVDVWQLELVDVWPTDSNLNGFFGLPEFSSEFFADANTRQIMSKVGVSGGFPLLDKNRKENANRCALTTFFATS